MFNKKLKRAICVMSSAVMLGTSLTSAPIFAATGSADASAIKSTVNNEYAQRFVDLYNIVKDDSTGYFSEDGVPYHSIETLMVEAPDQGHESTSEAASYYGWLESMKGQLTGDYSGLADAWDCIENYYIPTDEDQPGQDTYDASKPATYAAEYDDPSKYPSELMFDTTVGSDPLAAELKSTYGTSTIYGMHWLIDCDNFYGYGTRGDGTSTPSYINTYQRGKQESCFETIPQPSWENFNWGGSNGYLDLFTGDQSYAKQWRYTNAPDADARLIQAMWEAAQTATADGEDISEYVSDSSKMGDYLRYSMFDKYFMKIGAQGKTAASGRDSEHYLLSWYYAWGGGVGANWSWRIGCSHSHFGYQNPMTAYIMSQDEDFVADSATSQDDWSKSLQRQIEMYTWLQSDEGAIAGGCTNSWNGAYETYPAGTSTFYGMAYTPHPVYEDPGSNRWFGMQAWSMQRMCQYYYETGDEQVASLVQNWANWAASEVTVNADGTFAIPSNLTWTGQPETWDSSDSTSTWQGSSDLHCTVSTYGEDVGIAGSLSNALLYYSAAAQKYGTDDGSAVTVGQTAQNLLDSVWSNYKDDQGIASTGLWDSTSRFFEQEVYVPSGWTGTMPSGDTIDSNSTFLSIRSQYQDDPEFESCLAAYENNEDWETNYHRFWAQVEVAVANGVMAELFPSGEIKYEETEEVKATVSTPKTSYDFTDGAQTIKISATGSTNIDTDSISSVDVYVDDEKVGTINGASGTVNWTPEATTDEITKYTVKAVATSTSGTTAESSKKTVSIKWVKPVTSSEMSITTPKGSDSTNTIGGTFTLTNSGEAESLGNVTVRYYFTADGATSCTTFIDNVGLSLSEAPWYASLNSATTAKVVKMSNPTSTADSYLEVTFDTSYKLSNSGNLSLGVRVAKSDWSNFTQSNDYSYKNGAVIYVNGSCVTGNDIQ